MTKIVRTDSENADFIRLVNGLDLELAERDGDDHSFYAQFNNIDKLKNAVVAYQEGFPVAIGAFKYFEARTVEVKRMFVLPSFRGKGLAKQVLAELECWAAELGFEKCILETGLNQPEAIALYKKSDYKRIANYGQYAGVENSRCFEKIIDPKKA